MYFQIIYNLKTSRMTYRIPISKTTSCFLSYTIKAWNELPQDAKDCSSVASFKSKLNKNLHKKDHGLRGENILQCQFRKKVKNLNAYVKIS